MNREYRTFLPGVIEIVIKDKHYEVDCTPADTKGYEYLEFDPETDKRSVEEVAKAIEKLYDDNGFNKFETENMGDREWKRRLMSPYDIIWRTYYALEQAERKANNGEYVSITKISENPKEFAEHILRFPEVHAILLSEEFCYN